MASLQTDPTNVTLFERTTAELEDFILFAVAAAGKNAKQQAAKLKWFYDAVLDQNYVECEGIYPTPFQIVREVDRLGTLRHYLEQVRIGKYNLLERSYRALAHGNLDLRTCSLEALEAIPGISFKTSRFFVLHSRPNQRLAVLDTHILRYMREELGIEAPRHTPGSAKEYAKLEETFLEHADALGINVADLDLSIWLKYSKSAPLVSDEAVYPRG